tara:strand:- start:1259 stop:2185 length:927 start_codon:yes stop_codon:yes gene_type:complete
MILLADIGATNARFSITNEGSEYVYSDVLQVDDADSLEELCINYLNKHQLSKKVDKAVIGVAAPIINDQVSFVNTNISFSIKELKSKLFCKGLIVINDLALQAHAIKDLKEDELSFIGSGKEKPGGPKILVSPGTGLGLAGIINEEIVATEAGHLNIPQKEENLDLKRVFEVFISQKKRVPTYEDFLSGKGIKLIYDVLTQGDTPNLTSKEILDNKNLYKNCEDTRKLMVYLFASYLRYVALVWGSTGGVYLSGSIVNSLIKEELYLTFREIFEDSETMQELLKSIPLIIVKIDDIGFRGALKLSKNL